MTETVWVERRNATICGVYANMQPGYAEEELPADDPEVLAFHEAINNTINQVPPPSGVK